LHLQKVLYKLPGYHFVPFYLILSFFKLKMQSMTAK
jgi:hypothetical protein